MGKGHRKGGFNVLYDDVMKIRMKCLELVLTYYQNHGTSVPTVAEWVAEADALFAFIVGPKCFAKIATVDAAEPSKTPL